MGAVHEDVIDAIRQIWETEAADGQRFDPKPSRDHESKRMPSTRAYESKSQPAWTAPRCSCKLMSDSAMPSNPPRTTSTFPSYCQWSTRPIRAYPPEVVIAEEYQAMVLLGIANSRMKDFYDVCP
ncbi:MAG: nucleotidyl transferase AbiEii/AbiGii toxin family protein [Bryobacteraceae bacterium]